MSSSTDAVPGQERLVDQAYRQIRDAIVAVRLSRAPRWTRRRSVPRWGWGSPHP